MSVSDIEIPEQGPQVMAAKAPLALAVASSLALSSGSAAAAAATDASVDPAEPSPVAKDPYDMFGEVDEPVPVPKRPVVPVGRHQNCNRNN